MEETMEKVKRLGKMKETLVCAVDAELAKGIQQINVMEMSQAVDMIKDLAEAEKDCWEACYKKIMVEQVKRNEQMEEDMGRMGYDSWRYSSGRFAPTGRCHRTGYMPESEMYPYYPDSGMMGYSGGRSGGSQSGSSSSRGNYSGGSSGGRSGGSMSSQTGSSGYWPDQELRSEYGRAYDMFRDSRRHYTETHDQQDREKMKEHGREHVMETVATVKEIWQEADPDLRKQMKEQIVGLVNDMK